MNAENPGSRGLRAPGTAWMIVGSLVGALGAFLFQLLGGRALGTEGFAPIAALWTVVFIIATVILVPLEQFATREASRGRDVLRHDLWILVGVVVSGGLVGVGFVAGTLDRFFGGQATYMIQMAVMMCGYGILFAGRGILAGRRQFKSVGVLLAAESLLRLLLLQVALMISDRTEVVAWSMAVAPAAIWLVPFWTRMSTNGESRSEGSGRFLGAYTVGSIASQLLLAGSPLAVSFLGGSSALFSRMFMTFTLFRAPLTLIYSLQGRLLSMMVRLVEEGQRARVRGWSALIAGAGLALTALAWPVGRMVGPAVVRVLSRPEFEPTATVAAFVAAGVVAASAAQVTGQVQVAEGNTGRLAVAWISGLVAAVAILVLARAEPDQAVAQAFFVGELTALCVVGWSVIRKYRDRLTTADARPEAGVATV